MKKIAIIGGGAAGIGALLALRNKQDVHLFEQGSCLGGHAYTHHLKSSDGTSVSIDMGVEFIHERLSPNIFAFIEQLALKTYVAPLSFSAHDCKNAATSYWSNSCLAGELKHRLHDEMNHFHLQMIEVLQSPEVRFKSMSIGDYLDEKGYSTDFKLKALLPLMTTFSGCKAASLDYALLYVALSFNMQLLSFYAPSHWRKFVGGVDVYYKKVYQMFEEKIHLNEKIYKVINQGNKWCLVFKDGSKKKFDEVVFACQAKMVLQLMDKLGDIQKNLLRTFDYVNVTSILHQDTSLVANMRTKDYFQFQLSSQPTRDCPGILTRVNGHLLPYHDCKDDFFVTFDGQDQIDAGKILHQRDWLLPMLRPKDLTRKQKVSLIQGVDHLWYCGTDYTLTGHESAFVSGMVIGEHLGGEYPFEDAMLAKIQFDTIKRFMGLYRKEEKMLENINDWIFACSKKLNLHKRMTSRFMQDILF
jgi:uncharacterized protein